MKRASIGKLTSCILGALNGVVYATTMFLLIWRLDALAEERNLTRWAVTGDFIDFVSHERRSSIVIIWLLAFTLASLMVSSFWRKHKKGSVLFWEVIGLLAVAAWNAFAVFGSFLDKVYANDSMTFDWVTSWRNPLYGPISLAVVIPVNLAFAYLVGIFYSKFKINTP